MSCKPKKFETHNPQTDTTWAQTYRIWDKGKWEMRTSVIIKGPERYNRSGEVECDANFSNCRTVDRVFDTTVIGSFDSIVSIRGKFAKMAIDALNDLKKKRRQWEADQKAQADTLDMLSDGKN